MADLCSSERPLNIIRSSVLLLPALWLILVFIKAQLTRYQSVKFIYMAMSYKIRDINLYTEDYSILSQF